MNRKLIVFVSFVATPWLMLLSTAIPLYLHNQPDLFYQYDLLYDYFLVTFAIALTAFFFYWFTSRIAALERFRVVFWVYYLAGIAFLFVHPIRQIPVGTVAKTAIMLAALLFVLCLVPVLERRVGLPKAASFFALLSVLFALSDLSNLYFNLESNTPLHSKHNTVDIETDPELVGDKPLPNIYHLILDEYQTEMFELTLDRSVKEQLAGFHFFKDARTVYGRTGMSLPSIFTGREYDYSQSQLSYHKAAFNSEQSFLHWLHVAGYKVSAYIHPVYRFEQNLFEYLTFHRDLLGTELESERESSSRATFARLWAYASLPLSLSNRFIDAEYLEQQKNQNVLNPKAPAQSVHTMRRIIEEESRLEPHGRYLLAHLILPHFPYVLKEDCSHLPKWKKTPAVQQSRCATGLVVKFIEELKNLGRYEDSIIIVQSDHGGRFVVHNGQLRPAGGGYYGLPWSDARSKSLLLIKPNGRGDSNQSLEMSDLPASLLDVAPTLMALLGIELPGPVSGVDLFDQNNAIEERVRYYHFFEKKDKNEWTDEMTRYRIDAGQISLDRKIPLLNNPQPPLSP